MLDLACLAIVLLYLGLRLAREPRTQRVPFLLRLGALAVTGLVAEESMIYAYGFYAYDDVWSITLDRVPLLIALIWPIVIQSGWDLSGLLATGRARYVAAFGLVLTDAALIEPVAVRSGLWHWTQPGIFEVPVVGILGWALFATAALWALNHAASTDTVTGTGAGSDDREQPRRALPPIGAGTLGRLGLAVLATHAGLLTIWWGGLRSASAEVPLPIVHAVAYAVLIPLGLVSTYWGRRAGAVKAWQLWLRVPGAAFFFVLVARASEPALTLYSVAFGVPYIGLIMGSFRARGPASTPAALVPGHHRGQDASERVRGGWQ